jgi:hypothetical protein
MTRGILIVVPVVLAGWLGSMPSDVRGCAPATRSGEEVRIAEETAFVIWDDDNDVEHFVRQATFVGNAREFGFLVPTPNRPRVEPADSEIFRELARLAEPKTEYHTETSLSFGCLAKETATAENDSPDAKSDLVVLEQKRVGNLDAAVLAFRADKTRKIEDTADELLTWLSTRGYVVRPDLTEWLAPYIDRNWVITAFRIAAQPGPELPSAGSNIAVKASAVRLTFKTERPFFPYREPVSQRDEHSRASRRTLRVYLAAKERMAGTIGESLPWPGRTVWADAIAESDRTGFLERLKLPPETREGKWWITEFEDTSNPRPATDEVYFERSMDRGPVARTPIVVVTRKNPWWVGPLAIIVLIALGGAGMMFVRRYTGGSGEEALTETPPPLPPAPSSKTSDRGAPTDPRRWY